MISLADGISFFAQKLLFYRAHTLYSCMYAWQLTKKEQWDGNISIIRKSTYKFSIGINILNINIV